ncbi:MAG TPA: thioredoxin domain-containing protein [Candidatus Limnocylindrales bacterium]|nr:thioredoxin domain-containing protein [Candidatus Limnocylindrales bacterium]
MSSNDRSRPAATTARRERRRAERARRSQEPRSTATGRAHGPRGTSSTGPSLAVLATIGALVAGVVLIAAIVLLQKPAATGGAAAGGPDASFAAPAEIPPGDLGDTPGSLGSANAPLTMEITEDFQCPICGQFSNEQLSRLVDDFVRPGLLRIVAHDVDFLDRGSSTESLDAATAAACAGEQGRYWEYHAWLYANQHGENQGAFSPDRLRAIAGRVELDESSFAGCLAGPAERAKVTAATNVALAAGISATPTFVVNGGQPISGLPTYDALSSYLRGLLPSGSPGASAAAASASPS